MNCTLKKSRFIFSLSSRTVRQITFSIQKKFSIGRFPDLLMCFIVMRWRLMAKMVSTFSLWGSLFLMIIAVLFCMCLAGQQMIEVQCVSVKTGQIVPDQLCEKAGSEKPTFTKICVQPQCIIAVWVWKLSQFLVPYTFYNYITMIIVFAWSIRR